MKTPNHINPLALVEDITAEEAGVPPQPPTLPNAETLYTIPDEKFVHRMKQCEVWWNSSDDETESSSSSEEDTTGTSPPSQSRETKTKDQVTYRETWRAASCVFDDDGDEVSDNSTESSNPDTQAKSSIHWIGSGGSQPIDTSRIQWIGSGIDAVPVLRTTRNPTLHGNTSANTRDTTNSTVRWIGSGIDAVPVPRTTTSPTLHGNTSENNRDMTPTNTQNAKTKKPGRIEQSL